MSDINNKKFDEETVSKLTDLVTYHQIEDIKRGITLIEYNIEFYKFRIEDLKKCKPFWFQKNKLKSYYEELEKLEKKLEQYYNELFKEMKLIDELKISSNF